MATYSLVIDIVYSRNVQKNVSKRTFWMSPIEETVRVFKRGNMKDWQLWKPNYESTLSRILEWKIEQFFGMGWFDVWKLLTIWSLKNFSKALMCCLSCFIKSGRWFKTTGINGFFSKNFSSILFWFSPDSVEKIIFSSPISFKFYHFSPITGN